MLKLILLLALPALLLLAGPQLAGGVRRLSTPAAQTTMPAASLPPCAGDLGRGPGLATEQQLEAFISCYQSRQQQEARIIAPYARRSEAALQVVASLRQRLRSLIGIGG